MDEDTVQMLLSRDGRVLGGDAATLVPVDEILPKAMRGGRCLYLSAATSAAALRAMGAPVSASTWSFAKGKWMRASMAKGEIFPHAARYFLTTAYVRQCAAWMPVPPLGLVGKKVVVVRGGAGETGGRVHPDTIFAALRNAGDPEADARADSVHYAAMVATLRTALADPDAAIPEAGAVSRLAEVAGLAAAVVAKYAPDDPDVVGVHLAESGLLLPLRPDALGCAYLDDLAAGRRRAVFHAPIRDTMFWRGAPHNGVSLRAFAVAATLARAAVHTAETRVFVGRDGMGLVVLPATAPWLGAAAAAAVAGAGAGAGQADAAGAWFAAMIAPVLARAAMAPMARTGVAALMASPEAPALVRTVCAAQTPLAGEMAADEVTVRLDALLFPAPAARWVRGAPPDEGAMAGEWILSVWVGAHAGTTICICAPQSPVVLVVACGRGVSKALGRAAAAVVAPAGA